MRRPDRTAVDGTAHQVERMKFSPRMAQLLRKVGQPLGILEAKDAAPVPHRPVFAFFTEQRLVGRPTAEHRADAGGAESFTRLSLLYHHDCLFSFVATLAQQKARPRILTKVSSSHSS